MNARLLQPALLAGALLTTSLGLADDMIGVTWLGLTYSVDSTTGITQPLGDLGYTKCNAMAANATAGLFYVIAEQGDVLLEVSPAYGTVLRETAIDLIDVRAMAYHPVEGKLYVIEDVAGPADLDELWRLDPLSGAKEFVAVTDYVGLQGLAYRLEDGQLYSYDIGYQNQGEGLVRLDPATGAGTDLFPAIPEQDDYQWLSFDRSGQLFAGRKSVARIDLASGSEIVVGVHEPELRGAEFLLGKEIIGFRYCHPGIINSTGAWAVMSAVGSWDVADNDVRLISSRMPAGQFGMFLASETSGVIYPPGSQGKLCVAGSVGRYLPQVVGADGAFSLQLDLTQTPTPNGFMPIYPGEIWFFQAWFRDMNPHATSNFSDGWVIPFQ